jgi:hypothetical protein
MHDQREDLDVALEHQIPAMLFAHVHHLDVPRLEAMKVADGVVEGG